LKKSQKKKFISLFKKFLNIKNWKNWEENHLRDNMNEWEFMINPPDPDYYTGGMCLNNCIVTQRGYYSKGN
jgi:hypothetical protein